MNILLIDDHEVVRRGLQQLLSENLPAASYKEAGSVAAARELLRKGQWHLILLDINLPDGNGLELVQEVKAAHATTPVLVISAFPEEEFATRSFRLGADGYLTKASVADEMVTAARKLLEGGKYVTAAIAESLASAVGGLLPSEPHLLLSPRELEVLRMVATGKSIKEVAAELQLSEKTIGTYRSRISEKLGLSTNVALARYALKHRLVD